MHCTLAFQKVIGCWCMIDFCLIEPAPVECERSLERLKRLTRTWMWWIDRIREKQNSRFAMLDWIDWFWLSSILEPVCWHLTQSCIAFGEYILSLTCSVCSPKACPKNLTPCTALNQVHTMLSSLILGWRWWSTQAACSSRVDCNWCPTASAGSECLRGSCLPVLSALYLLHLVACRMSGEYKHRALCSLYAISFCLSVASHVMHQCIWWSRFCRHVLAAFLNTATS